MIYLILELISVFIFCKILAHAEIFFYNKKYIKETIVGIVGFICLVVILIIQISIFENIVGSIIVISITIITTLYHLLKNKENMFFLYNYVYLLSLTIWIISNYIIDI